MSSTDYFFILHVAGNLELHFIRCSVIQFNNICSFLVYLIYLFISALRVNYAVLSLLVNDDIDDEQFGQGKCNHVHLEVI